MRFEASRHEVSFDENDPVFFFRARETVSAANLHFLRQGLRMKLDYLTEELITITTDESTEDPHFWSDRHDWIIRDYSLYGILLFEVDSVQGDNDLHNLTTCENEQQSLE